MGLAITRKVGQTILMITPDGKQIHVTVEETRGRLVRIRIDAPREIEIHRDDWIKERVEAKDAE